VGLATGQVEGISEVAVLGRRIRAVLILEYHMLLERP